MLILWKKAEKCEKFTHICTNSKRLYKKSLKICYLLESRELDKEWDKLRQDRNKSSHCTSFK